MVVGEEEEEEERRGESKGRFRGVTAMVMVRLGKEERR